LQSHQASIMPQRTI